MGLRCTGAFGTVSAAASPPPTTHAQGWTPGLSPSRAAAWPGRAPRGQGPDEQGRRPPCPAASVVTQEDTTSVSSHRVPQGLQDPKAPLDSQAPP